MLKISTGLSSSESRNPSRITPPRFLRPDPSRTGERAWTNTGRRASPPTPPYDVYGLRRKIIMVNWWSGKYVHSMDGGLGGILHLVTEAPHRPSNRGILPRVNLGHSRHLPCCNAVPQIRGGRLGSLGSLGRLDILFEPSHRCYSDPGTLCGCLFAGRCTTAPVPIPGPKLRGKFS